MRVGEGETYKMLFAFIFSLFTPICNPIPPPLDYSTPVDPVYFLLNRLKFRFLTLKDVIYIQIILFLGFMSTAQAELNNAFGAES